MKRILITCLSLLVPYVGMAQNKFPVPATGPTIVEEINYLGERVTIFDLNGDRWDDLWVSTFYSKNPYRDITVDSDGDGLTDHMEMLNWSDPYKKNPLPKRQTSEDELKQQAFLLDQKEKINQERKKIKDRLSKNLAHSKGNNAKYSKEFFDKEMSRRIDLKRSQMSNIEKNLFIGNHSSDQLTHSNANAINVEYTGMGTSVVLVEKGSYEHPNLNQLEFNNEMTITPSSQYSSWLAAAPPSNTHTSQVASVIMGNGQGNLGLAKGFAPDTMMTWYPALPVEHSSHTILNISGLADTSNHSYGAYIWSPMNHEFPVGGGSFYHMWTSDPSVSMLEPNYAGQYFDYVGMVDEALNIKEQHLAVFTSGNNNKTTPHNTNSSYVSTDPYIAYNSTGLPYLETTLTPPPTPGGNTLEGWDTLIGSSMSKNAIVVGNIDMTDLLNINSSIGPTDDGRIKPDIVTIGTNVWVTDGIHLPTGQSQYSVKNGSSLAAPAVAGTALLMEEAREESGKPPLLAATKKAILIHTARDIGLLGPDYDTGYGALDTGKAVNHVKLDGQYDGNPFIKEIFIKNTVWSTFNVKCSPPPPPPGTNPLYSPTYPLKITICWNDLAPTATPPPKNSLDVDYKSLVNNLDLSVIDGYDGTTYYPWVKNKNSPELSATTGINNRDNVEQVLIEYAVPGRIYTIRIKQSPSTLLKAEPLLGPAGEGVSIVLSGVSPTYEGERSMKIKELSQVGDHEYGITWDSITGLDYKIEKSLDLQNWTTMESDIRAVGDVSSYIVESLEPKAFFRIATED